MPNKEKLFNLTKNKARRSRLRKIQTTPEKHLWTAIKNKQLGIKFRRQHGIGNYIVDFYCAELGLILEVDGDSHYSPGEILKDNRRTAFLESKKLVVLRFTNKDVMNNLNGVLEVLSEKIKKTAPPLTLPLVKGETRRGLNKKRRKI